MVQRLLFESLGPAVIDRLFVATARTRVQMDLNLSPA
jgi:hypothetical protein